MTDTPATIGVIGDVTIDWAVVTAPEVDAQLQHAYLWERKGTVTLAAMPGGAALLASLVQRAGGGPVVTSPVPAEALTDPGFARIPRSFTRWALFPESRGASVGRWRMNEFLGQAPATDAAAGDAIAGPAVLVIDDANLGFRDAPGRWEHTLASLPAEAQVFLKTTPPIASGALWERLIGSCPERLTVYVSLGDLRKEDAPIGQPLSWERTALEVVQAVRRHPELRKAGCVVVGIGLSGAVVVRPGAEATLVYDPAHLEADWEAKHPGTPWGVGSALTAALAALVAREPASEVCDSLGSGLGAARAMHKSGLALAMDGTASMPGFELRTDGASAFARRTIPEDHDWSILTASHEGNSSKTANAILMEGLRTPLAGIPIERMGAWTSVDRTEIEAIRGVRNIVREYLGRASRPRPLSLAVFGPPGSGKSFAIKQMAAELAQDGPRLQILEFNVSQFDGGDALGAAFQRVRDCAVEGSLPLVFWDEFDSARNGNEMGWLAPFLAPMQDGAFLEGSLVRPIGPAIFVFAGGTHATMESFKARAGDLPGAKATDFLSRLRGFVNVLGPNAADASDESFVVRRALLLRQMLQQRAPQLVSGDEVRIDPGVANAFLGIEKYVHGARSMEAIVEMSALSGRSRYARSSLPAAHQLALHVDAGKFLELLDRS